MARRGICSIPNCGKPHSARGWCLDHYTRWRRCGDPLGGRVNHGETERYFRSHVMTCTSDDCLIWPYGRTPSGYGKATIEGRRVDVHREACEYVNGPPPAPGYQAAHLCGNGRQGCVNPRHLMWKTPKANSDDKVTHGTMARGEKLGMSKLTEENVRSIRAMKGTHTRRELAEIFDTCPSNIAGILNRRRWAWLE